MDHDTDTGKCSMTEVQHASHDETTEIDAALTFLRNEASGGFDIDEEKTLLRKVDWMILPLLSLVYFLQFVDKNLINFANIMGLSKDTGMSPSQFSDLAWSFYLAYLLAEPLAGYLLQRLPVGKFLGCNVILWGICVALNSVCKNAASLIALRVLLGLFEACVTPSMLLIISMWYKRKEQPLRIGTWASTVGLGIIVGALCSYGFQHYHGKSFKSWQIMFLAFGLLTIFIGILVVLFLPDNPMKSRLTKREKAVAISRLRNDTTGVENKTFKRAQFQEALQDPHLWLMFAMTVAINIPNAAVSTFQATIIKSLGFTAQQAALLSMPSGVVAIVAIGAASYAAFKFQNRSLVIVALLVPGIIGAALMAFLPAHDQGGRLAGVYLTNTIPSSTPVIYSWVSANFAGHTKKITVNATILVAFCLGNILGPLTFTNPPDYTAAKITIIVVLCVAIMLLTVLVVLYRQQNKRKTSAMEADTHLTDNDEISFLDLTDRVNKTFLYIT